MSATSNGAAATSSAKRFELPALDFKFGSLTDGTDIPPPPPSPPSPKEEAPAPSPKVEVPLPKALPKEEVPSPPKTPLREEVEKKQETNGSANGHGTFPNKPEIDTITANVGTKRPAEDGPASPVPSNRGSLRRLLSRTLLNNAYDEQGSFLSPGTSRPPSRTASTIAEEKKSKRASGWFKRLRSNDTAKRASQVFEHPIEEPKKPAGPPPPMIPELSALKTKVDTHLGDDLFKGIK
ncbi:hypothetical protein F4815DRAFT_447639 [Daldinia loculata]|uniref:uncharacterized protein n=1 Tax=Daldinia loculata TaxID=103429 RepID=UPI0020C51F7F|nr:uncharacterized protein F4817DRAFT_356468 [Daldinia loculata]KAI1651065.1 hypothetical protein F4817DRAFT_356468 [Daldinia loculata]KAI2778055.1 hypothetical protein F4815DRAFT_447639 [Daldinia loculata]